MWRGSRHNLRAMPSGLVFIAIVVIWAVILVPRVARMYERGATERTTRRFQHAMASLGGSRRERRRSVDVMLVRRAPSSAAVGLLLDPAVDLHLDHGVDPFLGGDEELQVQRARREADRRVAAAKAAKRRRRTIGAFGVMALATAVASALGMLPLFAVGVPVGLLVALLGMSRWHVKRQSVWRAQVAARSAERRRARVLETMPVAPVVPVRRRIESNGATSPAATPARGQEGVRVLRPAEVAQLRSASGRAGRREGISRPGSLAAARLVEQYSALSATYTDAEDELGLDEYAAANVRYLRAANE